mmetsp:Transcript_37559/g.110996  ORF Transcript_37559/g.110996 Transcript_37559/m.110996 type:complete len:121 (+) Transcript_37559:368-730(+)
MLAAPQAVAMKVVLQAAPAAHLVATKRSWAEAVVATLAALTAGTTFRRGDRVLCQAALESLQAGAQPRPVAMEGRLGEGMDTCQKMPTTAASGGDMVIGWHCNLLLVLATRMHAMFVNAA